MATISNVAQRILDENNYTTSDCNLTNTEYLIDNAVDYVNLQAGTSIADLAGSAESKTLTGTEDEIAIVKVLSSLLLRAYVDKGPNIGVSAVSVAEVTSDPHYRVFMKLFNQGLNRLRGRSIDRV